MSVEIFLKEAEQRLGRRDFAGAEPAVSQALAIEPRNVRGLCYRAIIAAETGRREIAMGAIGLAVEIAPQLPAVMNNAAAIYFRLGEIVRARELWERLLRLAPQSVDAAYNLGVCCHRMGELDRSADYFMRVRALAGQHPQVHVNLGNVLKDAGRVDEAIEIFSEGTQRNPANGRALDNLLYALYFSPRFGEEEIFRAHEAWGRGFEAGIAAGGKFENDRSTERRLRVGYVSGDFCVHAESHFVTPLLEGHDKDAVEVHCYASVIKEDHVTKRIRRSAAHWHNVLEKNDDAVAEAIRGDRIDVLVDLTMHMEGTRLGVFARRSAPVQVTWLAYPGTTGLARMDYRLTDRYLDPDAERCVYTEKSWRLPGLWVCYDALTEAAAAAAREAGPVCFGSLNNPCKMNEALLEIWARLLAGVANSRLLLMAHSLRQKEMIWKIFEARGVARDRIEFVARLSRPEYLKIYDRIDIGLDPLPYNGITTTCDALWMGVPVVSMKGKTAAGRAGWGILESAGMGDLAADNKEEFVRIATRLAFDGERRAALRATLRGRVEASEMMDKREFARGVEDAYREMWKRWVASTR